LCALARCDISPTPAGQPTLIDYFLREIAREFDVDIIDQHGGTGPGQVQAMAAAYPSACAGDDRCFAFNNAGCCTHIS
jgi:hypothetical protein